MKILILGASSYVGARIYFDLRKDFEVIGTYSSNRLSDKLIKLNVTNRDEVISIIKKIKPDVIIHTANNANARWCEANPELAKELNERSTEYVVEAANIINAKVLYISSFAAIKPVNVYGNTKLASEELVRKVKAGWVILRSSLVIGYSPNTTNDRPFNRLLKNIDERTPAVYDTSWKFQPTWAGHISEVIKIILQKGINKQVIPIAVDGLKTRYDIAKDILTTFKISVTSINNHDTTEIIEEKSDKLQELILPTYSYKEIVSKIIQEIKQRKDFVI